MKTLEQLEAELLSVTDQVGRLMDQAMQKGFVPAFQCGHSGLYLPGDYVKEWGRSYGIGQGPHPSSEVLDSDYYSAPPPITPDIQSIEQIMHPLITTFAQVDFCMVHPSELEGRLAVLVKDDPKMKTRARIVRAKQLANPRGRLRNMQAAWEGANR